jgi:hypothetical protein
MQNLVKNDTAADEIERELLAMMRSMELKAAATTVPAQSNSEQPRRNFSVADEAKAVLVAIAENRTVARRSVLVLALLPFRYWKCDLSQYALNADERLGPWLARLALSEISFGAQELAVKLAFEICDPVSLSVVCPVAKIEMETGFGRAKLRSLFRQLQAQRLIEVVRRVNCNNMTLCNLYRVNLNGDERGNAVKRDGVFRWVGKRLKW